MVGILTLEPFDVLVAASDSGLVVGHFAAEFDELGL
jgi:hypothetical protein